MSRPNFFRKEAPCPICNGHPDLPQGKGVRCVGFLSADQKYAHCTRENLAGAIEPTAKASPMTYAHRLAGSCKCGQTHGAYIAPDAAPWAPTLHPSERGATFIAPVIPREVPMPPWRLPSANAPQAVYPWTDAAGQLLFFTVRREWSDRDTGERIKRVTPWTCWRWPDGSASWEKNGPPRGWLRPLFGLDAIASRADAPILVAEGEKDAQGGAKHFPDYVSTTWHGGAKAPHLTDWSPCHGRHLVLWPDNDPPHPVTGLREGVEAMKHVAQLARAAGAASVRIVELPANLPPKWGLGDLA